MAQFTVGKSLIEKKAANAANDDAFGGFNVGKSRATLTQLLAGIGNTRQFATYTKHDISHIDALLASTDWIIPEETHSILSTADALIITLSIYLHDLGMLVTHDEFKRRDESDFPSFKEALLADSSPRGISFRERLEAHDEGFQDEFLYEEFVRTHHAERIEAWLRGKDYERLGVAVAAVSIVTDVLKDLDPVIKNDIALIARSHHLDDLDDLTKYKTQRRYGSDADHLANLQYAAIVLRTADLLHMTRDRTPAVQFALTSPTDPMGQLEWRKQQSVRAVTPSASKPGIVEVHALFNEGDGFFALMDFLHYCESELQKSRAWAADAAGTHEGPDRYAFPWHAVDRDQVEAEGFERRQFSFQLDQEKVLELLTGHTLYNDAGVAIRELMQNSIDAVRLREFRRIPSPEDWDVEVHFDPVLRQLTLIDRGVGMSQSEIEQHFLKVGSSGYQSEAFKAQNPGFASISRFGIGVLSAFMIADELRVTTITPDDAFGRDLRLKSVHGRYLIKNMDRDSAEAKRIGPQGTAIELRLRPGNGSEDIHELLKKWILIPGCRIAFVDESGEFNPIGHDSVAQALESMLAAAYPKASTRAFSFSSGNGDHAVAQVWNEVYKEWEPLLVQDRTDEFGYEESERTAPFGGVSVQGIRVTFGSPSFNHGGPITLSNMTGSSAPRTNVARTDLEQGPALDSLIRSIYSAILESFVDEVEDIASRTSVRFALKEVRHMFADSFASPATGVAQRKILSDILSDQRLHAAEVDGAVRANSASDFAKDGFSVLVGPAADDAARFLDWLPNPKGVLSLLQEGGLLSAFPNDGRPLLAGQDGLTAYQSLLQERFEPSQIRAIEGDSSLLIDYSAADNRWISEQAYTRLIAKAYNGFREQLARTGDRRIYSSRALNMFARPSRVSLTDTNQFDVFFVANRRMFAAESELARLAVSLVDKLPEKEPEVAGHELAVLMLLGDSVDSWPGRNQDYSDIQEFVSSAMPESRGPTLPAREELISAAASLGTLRRWSSSAAYLRRSDNGIGVA